LQVVSGPWKAVLQTGTPTTFTDSRGVMFHPVADFPNRALANQHNSRSHIGDLHVSDLSC
jgi:hypothetical protein